MLSGQELLETVISEFHNSGGNLSLTVEELSTFFSLEASVAEQVIEQLCTTGWYEYTSRIDTSSGEETMRVQLDSKYRRNYWLYSALVSEEASALLELGALLNIPFNSRIKHLTIQDHHLTGLIIEDQTIPYLPESFGDLSHLSALKLVRCQLVSLPLSFGNLTLLTQVDLDNNQITSLPESLGGLRFLREFWCRNNHLISLPETLCSLVSLQVLSVDKNRLTSLPCRIGDLKNLRRLSIGNNSLTTLPESLGQLVKLQRLDVQNNYLATLPDSLPGLSNLCELNLNSNHFSFIPSTVTSLSKLQSLKVKHNRLASLPSNLTDLNQLKVVLVDGNRMNDEIWYPLLELYRSGVQILDSFTNFHPEIVTKTIHLHGNEFPVTFCLVGELHFQNLPPTFRSGVIGILLLFDKSDYRSFDLVGHWFDKLRHRSPYKLLPLALVGLITNTPIVSTTEGESLARELHIPYFESSIELDEVKVQMIRRLSTRRMVNPHELFYSLEKRILVIGSGKGGTPVSSLALTRQFTVDDVLLAEIYSSMFDLGRK